MSERFDKEDTSSPPCTSINEPYEAQAEIAELKEEIQRLRRERDAWEHLHDMHCDLTNCEGIAAP